MTSEPLFFERQTIPKVYWVIGLVCVLAVPLEFSRELEEMYRVGPLLVASVQVACIALWLGFRGIMETTVTDRELVVVYGMFRLVRHRFSIEQMIGAYAETSEVEYREFMGLRLRKELEWWPRKPFVGSTLNFMAGDRAVRLTIKHHPSSYSKTKVIVSRRAEELAAMLQKIIEKRDSSKI